MPGSFDLREPFTVITFALKSLQLTQAPFLLKIF